MSRVIAICCDISIGNIILTRLNELGKNQTWLATQCHVTRGQISHIITGYSYPSIKLLIALSTVLNVDSNILINSVSTR